MEDIQSQMGNILNNPDLMQQIMAMAQSMQNQTPPPKQEDTQTNQGGDFELPNIDIGMLQKLSGFATQSNIDSNQKNLLHALGPYLRQERITKLEKAMRAAKMARLATALLGQSGTFFGMGR